jgi:eukaryotic-like serine/threonine-protein kinase
MQGSNGERDLRQQLRQARSELEQCLRAGLDGRAEQVFARYPALAADADSALEIIYSTEFTIRDLRGEGPTPDEYYERFPQYRQALEELFRLHELLGGEEDPVSPDYLDLPVEDGTDWGVEHFQVLGPLGQHGPVWVVKARQLSRDRLVVVKMVAKEQTPPEELDRFRRGRDDQAGLCHPHIVQVYDRGEDEEDVFFTMEFGAGGTLAERVGGGPLSADEAARILHALAGAIQYAHEHKIIHRDLKPANVVLTADGTPKITDFGLAKRLEGESGPTRTGDLLGTPPYMAPEQAEGRVKIDERTDVYGLGTILYEMLTGRPPVQGKNEVDTLFQVRRCRVVFPRRHNRSVDRRLESICLKCLEKRRWWRYPAARALADDLERWQRQRRPLAHGLPARAGRQVRRHPRLTVLLLCGLALLATAVVTYLNDPERALQRALKRLAKGEEVTWIGKTCGPLYYRTVLPYKDEIIDQSDDGTFVFGSKTIGLLELVPDPQCSHYVFSAEVRCEEVDPSGDVGIYLLHSQHGAAGAPIARHWYCVVCFNDLPKAARKWLSLAVAHHFQPSNNQQQDSSGSRIDCPSSPERTWRKIVVEVSPTEIRLQWDGRQSITTSRRKLNKFVDSLYDGVLGLRPPEPRPPLAPRSSMGLYAQMGTASFRNVVLKPMNPVAGR